MTDPKDVFGFIGMESVPIFEYKIADIRKALTPSMVSNQGRAVGRVVRPINFDAAHQTTMAVTTHAVCIATKRDAIVGLGFETEEERVARQRKKELDDQMAALTAAAGPPQAPAAAKKPVPTAKQEHLGEGEADLQELPEDGEEGEEGDAASMGSRPKSKVSEILDPLCEDGFQSLLDQVGEDYETTGNGYIEVVREGDDGKIVALWHMPAGAVSVVNEETKPFTHFEVDDYGGTLKYANFGDAGAMRARLQSQQKQITELIHFKYPTAKNPKYGMPGWLSCVPWLELAQMLVQYNFDYFQNRAVPDLLLMITGAKVPPADMEKLTSQLKMTVGANQRFRTVVGNIPFPEAKVQLDRLSSDNRERFTDLWNTIELEIVSAHRVPPLLAGVVLPGKMAAANELPNALIAFQTLYVAQHQQVFELKLGQTLGMAGIGLQPTDFLLKKITDYYDMGQVETMSRMRETAVEAQARGRDLKDGLEE